MLRLCLKKTSVKTLLHEQTYHCLKAISLRTKDAQFFKNKVKQVHKIRLKID